MRDQTDYRMSVERGKRQGCSAQTVFKRSCLKGLTAPRQMAGYFELLLFFCHYIIINYVKAFLFPKIRTSFVVLQFRMSASGP